MPLRDQEFVRGDHERLRLQNTLLSRSHGCVVEHGRLPRFYNFSNDCVRLRARYDADVHNVYLGLGSNLGDRLGNLKSALRALEERMPIAKQSSLYESFPYGVGDQPLYLNMVVQVTTDIPPRQLLALVKKIEQDMGRMPQTHQKPRPIDIDILLYGDHVYKDEDLVIPHLHIHERHFVLVPLEEIASFHFHPVLKKPIIDLLDELGGYGNLVWRSEEQL